MSAFYVDVECRVNRNVLSVLKTASYCFKSSQFERACGILDYVDQKASSPKVVFVSRKIYKRFPGDKPFKFHRILRNENETIAALHEKFNKSNVQIIHMEDLGICSQVELAHSADVLIGVHGAGLVHLWWLHNESMIYEIEPFPKIYNPTFLMLAKLSGHRYMKQTISQINYYIDTKKIKKNMSVLHHT